MFFTFIIEHIYIKTIFSENHILLFSRPSCCENLTWWNLKGLAILLLANLTISNYQEKQNENSRVLLNLIGSTGKKFACLLFHVCIAFHCFKILTTWFCNVSLLYIIIWQECQQYISSKFQFSWNEIKLLHYN